MVLRSLKWCWIGAVLALSFLCDSQVSGVGFSLPNAQYNALEELFNSTNGAEWIYAEPYATNGYPWEFTTPPINPCSATLPWQGVTCTSDCSTEVCFVTELNLYQMNLVGVIPPQIGNLSTLTELILEHNSLYESIPSDIGNIRTLQTFKANNNLLTGTVPDSLCNSGGFRQLELYFNQLVGSLPSCFGELGRLEYLEFNNNMLTGSIPGSYGNLTQLKGLLLYSNLMNGSLPSSLQYMKNLESVYLYNNFFSHTIPSEYGNWTSLGYFSLSINLLSGSIPLTLGTIQTLNAFYLYENPLTGYLPNTFQYNPFLKSIAIGQTFVDGPIPEEWGYLPSLSELLLYQNRLTGPIPLTFYQLTSMLEFTLEANFITSTLPEGIGAWTKIAVFEVFDNLLSKSIPDGFLSQAEDLAELGLGTNQFTGTFPRLFCNMSGLEQLWIDDNEFHGTLPNCNFVSDEIDVLLVNGNQFTGTFPTRWTEQPVLTYLNVSLNHLAGTLPRELSRMTNAVFLDFYGNVFDGTVADIFANLTNLYDLSLGLNAFSGPFPALALTGTNQSALLVDVSQNSFTGSLPVSLFTTGRLESFVASINCFTGSIPSEVCDNHNLTDLVIDGLHSSSTCTKKIFSFSSRSAYALGGDITGSLPSCTMSMPKLHTLHAAGNGLTGSISIGSTGLGPLLFDLDLANNRLREDIPTALLTRQFVTLDLSFNHLDGTLASDMAAYANSTMTLYLQVNRLSGGVPATLVDAPNINILEGNIFRCDADTAHNLPVNDPNYNAYQCGSDFVNDSLLIWTLILATIIVCVALFAKVIAPRRKILGTPIADFAQSLTIHGFFHAFVMMNPQVFSLSGLYITNIHLLGIACQRLMRLLTFVLAYVLLCLMPVYGILTVFYGTYEYQYAWTVSLAFLSGNAPGVVVFLLLLGLLEALLLYLWRRRFDPKIEKVENQLDQQMLQRQNKIWRVVLSIVIAIVNCTIIVAVNAGYVLAVSRELPTGRLVFLTLLLSLFKYIWNSLIVIDLFGKCSERYLNIALHSAFLWSLALFNNIVAPYLAEAFVSSNCFHYAINSPPTVTSTYYGQDCSFIESFSDDVDASPLPERSFICVPEITSTGAISSQYGTVAVSSITFTPPFLYSYQCASSLLTVFGYVFVFRYLFSGLVQPCMLLCLKLLQERAFHRSGPFSWTFRLTTMCLPVLLRPLRSMAATATTSITTRSSTSGMPSGLFNAPAVEFTAAARVERERSRSASSNRSRPSHSHRTATHPDSVDQEVSDHGGFRLFDDNTRISGFTDEPNAASRSYRPRTSSINSHFAYPPNAKRSTAEINIHLIGQILQQHLFLRKALIIRLVGDIAVLLTFGVLFPPLSIVVIVSICADLLTVQVMIGRLVAMAFGRAESGLDAGEEVQLGGDAGGHMTAAALKEQQALRTLVTRLNEACEGFGPGLWKGLAYATVLATMFWSFSLFDTIADATTATVPALAIAVVILLVLAPLWLRGFNHAVYQSLRWCRQGLFPGSDAADDRYYLDSGKERTSELSTFQGRSALQGAGRGLPFAPNAAASVQNPLARPGYAHNQSGMTDQRDSDFSSVVVQ